MALHRADVEHLRSVFMAVENGDIGMLKSLGIRVRKIGGLPYLIVPTSGLGTWRCEIFPGKAG